MLPNYFVSTLGQGTTLNKEPKTYRTISEFLSYQAERHSTVLAVGFPVPPLNGREWSHHALSFSDVDRGTHVFAGRLSPYIQSEHNEPQTTALLCHSSPEFLFTWLGLIRLGCSVLLIAPQCQPTAIVHLCKACNVSLLFYDGAHANKAKEAKRSANIEDLGNLRAEQIPLHENEILFQVIRGGPKHDIIYPERDETAVAYLHHTSGTSSGLPKPIPQTHRAAVGALPRLSNNPPIATFTTTPLYHGGIADLFRSWTSNSLVWLFPGKDVPITARNICACLDVTTRLSSEKSYMPRTGYFSSVPYVLQMMEADEDGIEHLQRMDIVGVGGAALPADVGDRLVLNDVNLISRYGSAECGFLLSSYRDFTSDKEWKYLRDYNPSKLLSFEPRNEGLSELVIKPGWPHIAKTNRSDGSFMTADLFAQHPTIKNAWVYHSRADSQLSLITGKKFDPAPLEADLATSPHLEDVLIFGNSRPFPGVLLIRSEQSTAISDEALLATIKPKIIKLNQESQDHARIPLHMVILLPFQGEALEKSSKGTIIRKSAEAKFEDVIDRAYSAQEYREHKNVGDDDLSQYLLELIQSIVPDCNDLTEDADLFASGVDSIACIRLRGHLQRLIPGFQNDLPLNVVENSGTIQGLSKYIIQQRRGAVETRVNDQELPMLDFVKQFSLFNPQSSKPQIQTNRRRSVSYCSRTIVLTGATGALGAHILRLLRDDPTNEAIYCLVRGATDHAARERVNKALAQRGLEDLSRPSPLYQKIHVLRADLSDPHLGLTHDLYNLLSNTADLIIHIAWTVNFRLKLPSFASNLASVQNLLNLALGANRTPSPRFVYCSSTAAIINNTPDPTGVLRETISANPRAASSLGYSQSKWVAEHICAAAHSRTRLHGRVTVIRVGQLSGDSRTGVWNTKEAWPMMLSTAKLINCLPNLRDEVLDWLPVDIAAQAFLEATYTVHTTSSPSSSVADDVDADANADMVTLPVYHVLNPHEGPSWHTMLLWLQKRVTFDIVSPGEWVRRLEHVEREDVDDGGKTMGQKSDAKHSALKLLGMWKEAYGEEENGTGIVSGSENRDRAKEDMQNSKKQKPRFSIERTKEIVEVLRDLRPLDEVYMSRVWDWVVHHVD